MNTVRLESASRPPEIDYTSSKTTVYLRSNFEQVEVDGELRWRYDEQQHSKLAFLSGETLNRIGLSADKTSIVADGIDVATITAAIPVDAEYCFITVNGPPAEKANVVDGQVVREFTAETPGLYKVEFFAGNKTASMIIEVV